MADVSYEIDSNGIAVVTWDLEDRSMNVLNLRSIAEYKEIIEKCIKDDNVKGIVLRSAKDAFIAGADLTSSDVFGFDKVNEDKVKAAEKIYNGNMEMQMLFRNMETSGKPFVAAINGHALGGGFEICLSCHYRVAIDNDKIQIGQPEAKVGLIPGAGGTQRVPRLAGVTQEMMGFLLAGTPLTPKKALAAGLINEVVDEKDLIDAAKKYIIDGGKAVQPWDEKGYKFPGGLPYTPKGMMLWAAASSSLRKNSYNNYPAQTAILSAVYEGVQVPIDAGLRIEARYFTKVVMDPRAQNMVRSLFVNMQALSKGARRPKEFDKYDVKKIGILGAGLMGAGIAYVTAKAGIEVVLIDVDQGAADKGKEYSENILNKLLSKKKTTEEKKEKLLSLITPTTDYAHLKGADLIVEAVFENMVLVLPPAYNNPNDADYALLEFKILSESVPPPPLEPDYDGGVPNTSDDAGLETEPIDAGPPPDYCHIQIEYRYNVDELVYDHDRSPLYTRWALGPTEAVQNEFAYSSWNSSHAGGPPYFMASEETQSLYDCLTHEFYDIRIMQWTGNSTAGGFDIAYKPVAAPDWFEEGFIQCHRNVDDDDYSDDMP